MKSGNLENFYMEITQREKCPNMKLFLVRIQENMDQE